MSSRPIVTGLSEGVKLSRGGFILCWTGRHAHGVNHPPANSQGRFLSIQSQEGEVSQGPGEDMDVMRGDWLDGWEVEKSKSTTPAPGVLCKASLEMNKMSEWG